ncbi:MAG TPA: flagellar biosynthetic protein FliO [Steroidobacteraceae bacterium]
MSVRSAVCNFAPLIVGACAPWIGAPALAAAAPAAARAFAAPQAAGQISPAATVGLGQVTLALLAVLAAVFAVAWLVRRVRGFGNRVGTAIDVLAEIPLGPKERAVLLKVGQAQILLGVAPGRVSTLHVLAEPLDLTRPAAASMDRPTFRALMLRSLGK